MTRYSLDATTVTAILKHDQKVVGTLNSKFAQNHEIILCPFVYYEVKRWLLKKAAMTQMGALEKLAHARSWFEFDRKIWETAAQAWADATKRGIGTIRQDPDLLIAHHAKHFRAILVTSNTKDFVHYLSSQELEDWAL
jgi:predicted nucleic acid-binding protein